MFHSRALMRCAWGWPLVAVVVLTVAVQAQTPAAPSMPPKSAAPLTIAGDVSNPLTLSPADLKSYPRTTVTIQDEGRAVTSEGVLLGELLSRAGAPLGAELRGNNVASYVLAKARDGYQVVFSLAEVDPSFTGSQIIVADSIDGKPLFDYQGPLRIVAPGDKRGARSIRMLERIEIVRVSK
jgi:DMSO/TMAO reductase YedYZ molybdopterin-dependent catalytic subunit